MGLDTRVKELERRHPKRGRLLIRYANDPQERPPDKFYDARAKCWLDAPAPEDEVLTISYGKWPPY
jgi:hypothetical protein